MPNAADIQIDTDASFLLVGDGGTHKSFFIGTCPSPIYVADTDKGMAIHRGRSDIDYDTFKELPPDEKLTTTGRFQGEGWYEYGTAWPALLAKINEIGRSIDSGTCKYRTIGVDSLTMCTSICQSYILKQNKRKQMEIQDWGTFLNNMTALFSQLTGWPLIKVLTAHIMRDENLVTKAIEKLPLVPGKFSGVVAAMFDETYHAMVKFEPNKPGAWTLQTQQDATVKFAKSRKYDLPNNTPTDFAHVLKHIQSKKLKP
jgi:hypothetical protein